MGAVEEGTVGDLCKQKAAGRCNLLGGTFRRELVFFWPITELQDLKQHVNSAIDIHCPFFISLAAQMPGFSCCDSRTLGFQRLVVLSWDHES